MAKPFLKWAGGKTQLFPEIEARLPDLVKHEPFVYVEPFVGSGAVLFWVLQHFPWVKKVVINDINLDLCGCYEVVRNDVEELISVLSRWEQEYYAVLGNEKKKKAFFYAKRELFNQRNSDQVSQSALFIFLNKTCFNGLFRVNKRNEFNVPIGSYKKPKICNKKNLREVSLLLEKVTILNGDYQEAMQHIEEKAFFYLDPPYKPINSTSSFNTYAQKVFGDDQQVRLKEFCDLLEKKGHKWMLSNSDVKNYNSDDHFFDDLYADYVIKRVNANRRINVDAAKRGHLTELLISNF